MARLQKIRINSGSTMSYEFRQEKEATECEAITELYKKPHKD